MKDLPKEWNGVVVMDWRDGFWDKMKKRLSQKPCATSLTYSLIWNIIDTKCHMIWRMIMRTIQMTLDDDLVKFETG